MEERIERIHGKWSPYLFCVPQKFLYGKIDKMMLSFVEVTWG